MPNVMAALPNIGDALLECRAVTLPKTRNPLKLHGVPVPQTNETISAASGPKFTIL